MSNPDVAREDNGERRPSQREMPERAMNQKSTFREQNLNLIRQRNHLILPSRSSKLILTSNSYGSLSTPPLSKREFYFSYSVPVPPLCIRYVIGQG